MQEELRMKNYGGGPVCLPLILSSLNGAHDLLSHDYCHHNIVLN